MRRPYRNTIVGVETFMAIAGLGGAAQLIAGVATPPDRQLPFGWSSWTLPGVWLLATVAVPSLIAAGLALARNGRAPLATLCAAALLAVELVVQIPFIGTSWLQLACGVIAGSMAAVAWRARSHGWR